MLPRELIDRLRDLADEQDAAADKLFRKAKRGGHMADLDRSEAVSGRGRADFLRDVADALDRADADLRAAAERVTTIARQVRR